MRNDHPHQEYSKRLRDRLGLVEAFGWQESWGGRGRVIAFLAGLGLAGLVFGPGWLAPYWLTIPFSAFVACTIWREWAGERRAHYGASADIYRLGLARLEDRWSGMGEDGERLIDANHAYALDLDILGAGSLFQRMCRARTRAGEDRLAAWLLGPSEPTAIRERQAAVVELRPKLDFREDLERLGGGVRAGINVADLALWGRETGPEVKWFRLAAGMSALASVACLAAWLSWGAPRPLFLGAVIVQFSLAIFLRSRVEEILAAVDRRARDLRILQGILGRLEREEVEAARLRWLRGRLEGGGWPPSRQIRQLARLLERIEWAHNQIFAPLAALVLWTTQHALAIEAWRKRSGAAIGAWLEVIAEVEALSSLAAYAYECPEDVFAEVVEDGARFEGWAIGHPLLPREWCVSNDVQLSASMQLLVVSGSNMSGKSTLLRTVGVSAVLALAGAPVRAKRLIVSAVAVGATLRVQDSLQAGHSHFYAEITRVRQLVAIAQGTLPLLFLIDEIFQGTNSYDRRLGAEAVVRGLVERGAIGLITTHDLALTQIAEQLAPRAKNVHFADHFENGQMTFDYRMRPGVVTKSNALALMRAVGLQIPEELAGEHGTGAPGVERTAGPA